MLQASQKLTIWKEKQQHNSRQQGVIAQRRGNVAKYNWSSDGPEGGLARNESSRLSDSLAPQKEQSTELKLK